MPATEPLDLPFPDESERSAPAASLRSRAAVQGGVLAGGSGHGWVHFLGELGRVVVAGAGHGAPEPEAGA